jgi:hypothetical protein
MPLCIRSIIRLCEGVHHCFPAPAASHPPSVDSPRPLPQLARGTTAACRGWRRLHTASPVASLSQRAERPQWPMAGRDACLGNLVLRSTTALYKIHALAHPLLPPKKWNAPWPAHSGMAFAVATDEVVLDSWNWRGGRPGIGRSWCWKMISTQLPTALCPQVVYL